MRRGSPLIWVAVSALLILAFWELAEVFAFSTGVIAFDIALSEAITSLRAPWLTTLMRFATELGGSIVVTAATVSLMAWHYSHGRRTDAIFSAVVVAGGGLLSTLAKGRFVRPRPLGDGAVIAIPDSYSFPSGHSMGSVCLAAVLVYAVAVSEMQRPYKVLAIAGCVFYALLVGFSRVYLGVHFPSDVVASWLLGGALISVVAGARGLVRANG